ncbi:MAG TPA: hypothetical protein VFN73_06165 [Propionibacteriaceae bacterium]|nr:hypothetical protein [Propionibacteriaceae bacterium]
MSTADAATQGLPGGRLPLLADEDLDEEQRRLRRRIADSRGAAAERSGYVAALPDGRLIGPFNAMLHSPAVATGMLSWAQTIDGALDAGGMAPVVRETVILTVAAHRSGAYAVYAHSSAARRAGLGAEAVTALAARRAPADLPPAAAVAHRLARVLAEGGAVDDATYAEAVATFGIPLLVTLVSLVGQYLTTCAVLACFDVPAPEDPREAS